MSQTNTQYANYTLQSLIVSALEKDGALCSFFAKNYDEQGTYEGGSGFRKAFKGYNDRILNYHTLLKVLTGEQRANIYESIPTIDFLNKGNTSLLYTYETENGRINTTTIRRASSEEKTALDLILNEDPFTINRAIVGEPIAEHFYNTTGNSSSPNLQTSPWLGNSHTEYLYKGIIEDKLRVNDKSLEPSVIKIPMYSLEVEDQESTVEGFDAYSSDTSYIQFNLQSKTLDDDVITKLNKLEVTYFCKNGKYDSTKIWGFKGDNSGADPYQVNDTTFLTYDSSKDVNSQYQVELNAEDIGVILPKSVLGGLGTLLVFKKDPSVKSSEGIVSLTWGDYYTLDNNKEWSDQVKGLSSLEEVSKGDIYHLSPYPKESFKEKTEDKIRDASNLPVSVPDHLQTDVDVIYIGDTNDASNKDNWKILGKNYKVFYFPITSYTTSNTFQETKVEEALPEYLERTGVYEILKEFTDVERVYTAEASGLLCGLYCEPYKRDNTLVEDQSSIPESTSKVTLWKFINDTDAAASKGVAIDVGAKYFKGHLLNRGYFDDAPLKLTEKDYTLNIPGVCKPSSDGKHLIRLADDSFYKGKALLTYDILKNATSTLFDRVKIKDNFNSFPIKVIDEVVTRADYDGRTYSSAETKNLLADDEISKLTRNSNSTFTYTSILNYPEKFTSFNENGDDIADSEQIIKYFETLTDAIKRNEDDEEESYTLRLDLSDDDGPCVSRKTTYQKITTSHDVAYVDTKQVLWFDVVTDSGTRPEEETNISVTPYESGGSLGDIYTQLNKNFAVSYSVKLKDITAADMEKIQKGDASYLDFNVQDGKAYDFSIKMLTPMEVFSTKNTSISSEFIEVNRGSSFDSTTLLSATSRLVPTGTILVYPEYSKYLPSTLFLLSKEDLGLEEAVNSEPGRSIVSFVAKDTNAKPNSVISYRVANVSSFKPSKITKVEVTTDSNHHEIVDYPNGLYPYYTVKEHYYISGFEIQYVKTSSSSVTSSQGVTFNYQDLLNGCYKVKDLASSDVIYREDYNVGIEDVPSTISETPSNSKVVNKLSALMTDIKENSIEEISIPQYTSSEDSLLSNNLLSRESSSTKNSSRVSSLEKEIASQKDRTFPGYGDLNSGNSEVVSKYNFNDDKGPLVVSGESIAASNDISMGSSSSTLSSATQSGMNMYYTNRISGNITYDENGEEVLQMVAMDVPVYSVYYTYEGHTSRAFDCYIYTLEPIQLDLDDINLYGQDNEPIELSGISNVEIYPMSYPPSYFGTSDLRNSKNEVVKVLKYKTDVATLKDRFIVPGLPDFNTKDDLLRTYTRGIPMDAIANMIFSEDSGTSQEIGSILGTATLSILKSWKLSGGSDAESTTSNPLLLEDLPEVVKGLTEATPVLKKLSTSNFEVNLGGEKYTLSPDDILPLVERISNDTLLRERSYTIEASYTPDKTYLSSSRETYNANFIAELKRRLNTIKVESSTIKEIKRPSLRRVADQVALAFSSSDSLTGELCKSLDNFFGNDTKAFLRMGEANPNTFSSNLEDVFPTNTDSISTVSSLLNTKLTDIILEMANEVEGSTYLPDIKSVLAKYFKNVDTLNLTEVPSYNSLTSFVKNLNLPVQDYASSSEIKNYLIKLKESLIYTPVLFGFTYYFTWKRLTFRKWINKYKVGADSISPDDFNTRRDYTTAKKIKNYLLIAAQNLTIEALETLYLSKEKDMPTRAKVEDYLNSTQSGETHKNAVFGTLRNLTPDEKESLQAGESGVGFCCTEILPVYVKDTKTFQPLVKFSELQRSTAGYKSRQPFTSNYTIEGVSYKGDPYNEKAFASIFENTARQTFVVYSDTACDVKTILLKGIAEYVKTALEGTGSNRYYVKYLSGDSKPSGRTNSLYYKRYLALNNRMNTASGTLSPLIPLYRNSEYLNAEDDYARNVNESYSGVMSVAPVAKMSELVWMPPTEASGTTIKLPGKFYYKAELESLKEKIGDQCILTCNKCSVQNSCPFYNPEEIIKLYCTPAETIDLYFKDNKLDLISYVTEKSTDEKGETVEISYPNVKEIADDGLSTSSIDVDKLKRAHSVYNDILKKIDGDSSKTEQFTGNDIQQVRKELSGKNEFDDVVDGEDMGYLLGARYGTVKRNNMMVLANKDDSFVEFGKTKDTKLPTYQYLYDALYIPDEFTYFNYKTSSQVYNVSFDKKTSTSKKTYQGQVKIELPSSLKILENASPSDHVYLVSDDTHDDSGNTILPVVYLGQVRNLQWTFGIIEDPARSIQNEYDTNIYASDIAQWCINYYKGNCVDNPLEDIGDDPSSPTRDEEEDHDQYWMSTIEKKVYDSDGNGSWITVEGRPRISAGYTEPLVDISSINEAKVACGKPVAANYINFIRRFSIRICRADQYDEAGNYQDDLTWMIPWVRGKNSDESKTTSSGKKITWDTQRAALQFMKTNLRLVVVKNG